MKLRNLFYFLIFVEIISCKNNFYSVNDFEKVPKIDAHYHIYTDKENSVEQAKRDNFRLVCINFYSGDCEEVMFTHRRLKEISGKYPGIITYTTAFCLDGWDEPGWIEKTIGWIDHCIDEGAIGVKVWKNIGMSFRNKDSILIMIDDSQFDPIFKHLAEKGIPLFSHLGEPKDCWLPLDEMITKNDKRYYANHPEYYMYNHPEYPSYDEQIEACKRMLKKNPDLIFIGCHLASLEWDVDKLAQFLDQFPNVAVDIAARMGQLFCQTRENRDKVRHFFLTYQNRILYGTDNTDHEEKKEKFQSEVHQTWLRDWEYLVTDNEMTSSSLIDGIFRGLKLPKKVIDKIYYANATRWYRCKFSIERSIKSPLQ